ncbi:MAG: DUF2357 domain-containing protein [Clostridia bacterium]|nr:DUF2357 domain-containing protein [Clostridia bacterium]
MSQQVEKVYREYYNKFVDLVESDDFYNFVIANIGAGRKKISFYHKKRDKKIDDRWITQIEDCIVELDSIIRNPRRFIVQEDEIVPIEKARRITNESVRHLAQHTNLIAKVDPKGNVTPNEILNVYREESFDIYENRFIYTLLKRVLEFVETRRNVLFAVTEDEEIAELGMEGNFVNTDENVSYKVEISAHQTQSMLETDTKHMNAFARIDRLDRILKGFMLSPFAKSMKGSVPVRPPIMRTNVILKDPNFKKCLMLWQFIETYNEIGYSIDSINEYKQLDEQSVFALYNTLALNYMCLKKNADSDEEYDTHRKQRQIKPKFIKNIIEEIVEDYNVTETEVRKVFLDEITRAAKKREKDDSVVEEAIKNALEADKAERLAIEKARREEEARLAEIEKKRIEKEKQKERLRIEREEAARKRKEEREKLQKQRAIEKEKERQKLLAQREKEKAAARKAKELEKAKEKAKKEKEKAKLRELAIKEKEKAKAKERAQKEREKAKAKEKALREKEKAKALALKEKEKAKALALKEKEKAKAKAQKEKEKNKIALKKDSAKSKQNNTRENADISESGAPVIGGQSDDLKTDFIQMIPESILKADDNK